MELKIYDEQHKLGIGGLVPECRTYLAEINVRESLLVCVSKGQWTALICLNILEKNWNEVLEMGKNWAWNV